MPADLPPGYVAALDQLDAEINDLERRQKLATSRLDRRQVERARRALYVRLERDIARLEHRNRELLRERDGFGDDR